MFPVFCLGCGWSVMVSASPSVSAVQVAEVTADADHWRNMYSSVNVRPEQIAYQSEDKYAQYIESSKNNKESPQTVQLLPAGSRENDICTKTIRNRKCAKFQKILYGSRGMCFIFSLFLLYYNHELLRMMALHTFPCWKSYESDRPALQSVLFFYIYLLMTHLTPFLYGSYITVITS